MFVTQLTSLRLRFSANGSDVRISVVHAKLHSIWTSNSSEDDAKFFCNGWGVENTIQSDEIPTFLLSILNNETNNKFYMLGVVIFHIDAGHNATSVAVGHFPVSSRLIFL